MLNKKDNVFKKVDLYWCDASSFDIEKLKGLSRLNQFDICNALKYKQEIDQKEHLVSTYLKKKYIGENIYLNEFGKPLSEGIYFNISHSKGVVVLAISTDYDIGVDIEKVREVNDGLAEYVCNEDELASISTESDFFKIWTSKESLAKAYGQGINGKIAEIPTLPFNGLKQYKEETYRSHVIENSGYVLSISLKTSDDFIINFKEEII